MKYTDLTLHQRISLKGLFASQKEREAIGLKDSKSLEAIHAVMVLWDFKTAIEYFLNEDINLLYSRTKMSFA